MLIDVDTLRKDMQEESLGAFFPGGFSADKEKAMELHYTVTCDNGDFSNFACYAYDLINEKEIEISDDTE